MTRFSPSDAALEGFRLVRERPGTILIWSGLYFIGVMIISLIMVFSLGPDFIGFIRDGGMETGDAAAFGKALEHSWPAFIVVLLLVVVLASILSGGVYRLVLRPNEPGLAHLRLGADEMRLTVVNIVLYSVGTFFLFFLVLAAGVLGKTTGLGGVLSGLIIAGAMIWIGVRFLLATPMTFGERRITIQQSWRLTRGRFWPLFGMSILALIFYVIVWLLFSIIGAAFVALAGGQTAMEDPSQLSGFAIVAFVLTLVVQLLLPVLQVVMLYAPLAVAYRDLTHPEGVEAETF